MSTIAAELEHLRLTFRARRVKQVVDALHDRRSDQASGAVPPALDLAIVDFSDELAEVQARLSGKEPPP